MTDEVMVRVPLDPVNLQRLQRLAITERRAASDQASILLADALSSRDQRDPTDPDQDLQP